jgi:hypothetical protein
MSWRKIEPHWRSRFKLLAKAALCADADAEGAIYVLLASARSFFVGFARVKPRPPYPF